jgi:cell division protein FtsB
MRIIFLGFLIIAAGMLATQSYRLIRRFRHTEREYEDVMRKITPLMADNATIKANLEKLKMGTGAERALHNAGYAAEGETMVIIIPPKKP